MNIAIVTPPTIEPVALAEAKEHLGIDGADHDALVGLLITSAREQVEDVTRRAIMTQTWDYFLDDWPEGDAIVLPFGKLASVTSVKWKDDDGTETTLAVTTDYLVEANGEACGRIVLPYGKTWPSGTLYPSNPVTIRFVCGWTTAALVPARIKAAIKMLCADQYEHRGDRIVGAVVTENKTVQSLLWPLRLWDAF